PPGPDRLASSLAWSRAPVSDDGASLVHLFHVDQVPDLGDHAPDLRTIVLHHAVPDALQTERSHGGLLLAGTVDDAAALGHLELHDSPPIWSSACLARRLASAASTASSIGRGATWWTSRPLSLATSSGRRRPRRPATAACTMLIGLPEPRDLERMSLIPAASTTARTGPPAMTPVPGAAGFSSTTPAPSSPSTWWGIVVPMSGTSNMVFLASSEPLAMAAG